MGAGGGGQIMQVWDKAVSAGNAKRNSSKPHVSEVCDELADDLAFRCAGGEGEQAQVLEVLVGQEDVEVTV